MCTPKASPRLLSDFGSVAQNSQCMQITLLKRKYLERRLSKNL